MDVGFLIRSKKYFHGKSEDESCSVNYLVAKLLLDDKTRTVPNMTVSWKKRRDKMNYLITW